jgi:hypothetical protein
MSNKKLNKEAAEAFITGLGGYDDDIEESSEARVEKEVSKPAPPHPRSRPEKDKNGKKPEMKRLNLIILPALHEDIHKIAVAKDISLNETVNRALREYRDKEKRSLEKYEEIQRVREM